VGSLSGRKIAVLGLSFKPNTDDMREAVSIRVVKKLLEKGASVSVYDPIAMENARAIFGDEVEYSRSAVDCIRDADCTIVVTEWDEFRDLRPEDFLRNMRQPVVDDGRRIYRPDEFAGRVRFSAIGLGNIH